MLEEGLLEEVQKLKSMGYHRGMVQNGLIDEVKHLKEMGYHRGMVSMQGLGYKEILAYLDGEYPLEEAVRILKEIPDTSPSASLPGFAEKKIRFG